MSTLQLDDGQTQALQELRSRMSNLLQPKHDDVFLLRWLKARDFNVDAAEKMLQEDFKARKKIGCDTILEDFVLNPAIEPYICDRFLGIDNDGNAVHMYCAGTPDLKGFTRAMTLLDSVRYFAHNFEYDLKQIEENNLKTGNNAAKITFLVDMSNHRPSMWFDKRVLKFGLYVLNYYQDHYPETMNITYIVNTPSLFWYLFNIFKPFFNEVILSKLKIFETGDESWKKDFFALVPKEIVPAYLGGELCKPDSKCSDLIGWNKTMPTSLYLPDMTTLKTSDPDVKQKLVRERSIFEIEKDIEKTDVILCWEFQTKDHNIKFGLFYKKKLPRNRQSFSSESNEREELIPVESVDCNEFVEKGEYVCRNPGIYILHFDNTYSWIRSKHLLYKIEVHSCHQPISPNDL